MESTRCQQKIQNYRTKHSVLLSNIIISLAHKQLFIIIVVTGYYYSQELVTSTLPNIHRLRNSRSYDIVSTEIPQKGKVRKIPRNVHEPHPTELYWENSHTIIFFICISIFQLQIHILFIKVGTGCTDVSITIIIPCWQCP